MHDQRCYQTFHICLKVSLMRTCLIFQVHCKHRIFLISRVNDLRPFVSSSACLCVFVFQRLFISGFVCPLLSTHLCLLCFPCVTFWRHHRRTATPPPAAVQHKHTLGASRRSGSGSGFGNNRCQILSPPQGFSYIKIQDSRFLHRHM